MTQVPCQIASTNQCNLGIGIQVLFQWFFMRLKDLLTKVNKFLLDRGSIGHKKTRLYAGLGEFIEEN